MAVALGLVPLVVLEAGLRLVGAGTTDPSTDPFVGFDAQRRLFVPTEDGERFQIDPGLSQFFEPATFAAKKPGNGFRVFCLGGSTVQGRPFQPATAFPRWLELSLEAAQPSRTWEVVNVGGVSYASYRLAPILGEILGQHKPDLIILYTGHNEFLEDRSYAHIKAIPRPVRGALGALARLRTYRVARGAVDRLLGGSPPPADEVTELPEKVDAILDHRDGLRRYRRDEAWRSGVVAHFAYNVDRMAKLAESRDVPLWIVNPGVNLETPPFKVAPSDALTNEERARFEDCLERARSLYRTDLPGAVEQLRDATRIDPRHAGAWFSLGKVLRRVGLDAEARNALVRAKDEDLCPLRILTPMRDDLGAIVEAHRLTRVDVDAALRERSEGGITGYDWFVDHVHPTIDGHKFIASQLMDAFLRQGHVMIEREDWIAHRDATFAEQIASLDAMYYLRGERQLDALNRWAAGRAGRDIPEADEAGTGSEEGVDPGRGPGRRERDQRPEQQQGDQDRREPPLPVLTEEGDELTDQ